MMRVTSAQESFWFSTHVNIDHMSTGDQEGIKYDASRRIIAHFN